MLNALQMFLTTPLDDALKKRDAAEIESHVLDLFHSVASEVPAYRAFLLEQGIEAREIVSLSRFQSLPLTTKSNYLQHHSLAQVCRQGHLESCDIIAVSSGSTGEPTFWPRSIADEYQIATRFEQVFKDSFAADQHRTLAVVCFALGTWVGGMYTANCCRHLAAKGYPITTITPGSNKSEILRVVQKLSPLFEQTVLLGYPPFLKDVIDSGIVQGIPWGRYGVKLVMAGEVISEEWRSLVTQRVGSTRPSYDCASLYGTADAGVLGNETPLSICIRQWLAAHPDAARELFGESRLPSLVQYDPLSRFFEVQDGTLLFSGDNGIPLIRYHIADSGGILDFEALLSLLAQKGFDVAQALGENYNIRPFPFVYVFGRAQFAISYFGANLYPENVSVALEQSPIAEWVTGKFVMRVEFDAGQNASLKIVVELAPGMESSDQRRDAIASSIQHHLCRLNSEFANYVPKNYQLPQVMLLQTGDADYFPAGVKHRYTRPPISKSD